jgi:hypothetical protein
VMRVGGQRPFRLVLMRIVGSTGTVLETWVWENLLPPPLRCAAGARQETCQNIRRFETAR